MVDFALIGAAGFVAPRHPEKPGRLLMNIGIHFVDLLLWVFGSAVKRKSLALANNG
jgi:predicted dehydrogenase